MIHLPVILAEGSFGPLRMADLLLGAGLVLVAGWMVFVIRRQRRGAGRRVTAREQLERTRNREAIRGDLETLMVEIEQFATRMGAELDAKAVRLERLIERAERLAGDGGGAWPIGNGGSGESGDEDHDRPPARIDERARGGGGGGGGVVEDPLTRSVYELADQGRTPPQIARALSEHVGKVELILALRGH